MSIPEVIFLIVILLMGIGTLALLLHSRRKEPAGKKERTPKPVLPEQPLIVREVPGLMPEDSDDVCSLYHYTPEQVKNCCPWCGCENDVAAVYCDACGRIL